MPSPRLATYLLYAVLAGSLAQVALGAWKSGARPVQLALCVLCFTLLCALQVLHARPRPSDGRWRSRTVTLSAQVLLTYVPLPWLGNPWETAGDFLGVSVLLLLPSRLKWHAFSAVLTGNLLIVGARHGGPLLVASTASTALVTSLALYAVSRMTWLTSELRRARARLDSAVFQERRRFARDLHDLLGHSLSAITLKTEVALRHAPLRHERIHEELTSILATSRSALADVRRTAYGYQSLSLAVELELCVDTLRSASLKVDLRASTAPPEGRAGTVLSIVLREAVTNMLQHSKVRHCAIDLERADRRVRLRIVNDGVDPDDSALPAADAPGGCGLANLEARLSAVGGVLTAVRGAGGRFEVTAEIPDAPDDRPAHADGGEGWTGRGRTPDSLPGNDRITRNGHALGGRGGGEPAPDGRAGELRAGDGRRGARRAGGDDGRWRRPEQEVQRGEPGRAPASAAAPCDRPCGRENPGWVPASRTSPAEQ
ncbi:sensor histidine kinase [Streptomyces sp. NPDC085596]|uniref:sensor histidine kinase n=1 Tax=Streptomyces sp. NPDC085596 TaxID=3365731 RepID=UPI0037D11835